MFLATDEVAGRQVALKMFFASSARGGAAYERFVREARLASTLRHPSLVEVYDVSVERGFLVMEYLPGGSLAQRLASGERLAGAQVRRMALDIIGGLEAAHHRGVVHRDVKPANVFFDARGTAKLGDFGVAHLVDLGQTQTGGLIGTLAYMSPEQITGAPISIAADLYALGVTLFEALTGRLPFLGPDFVAQHLGEDAAAARRRVGDDVDAGWDPMLAGLLVKNPRERTQTLGDLRRAARGARPRRPPADRPAREARDARRTRSPQLAAEDDEVGPRYQFETPLGTTPLSQLARAVDTVLDRSVVIERFDASDDAHARARARAPARPRAEPVRPARARPRSRRAHRGVRGAVRRVARRRDAAAAAGRGRAPAQAARARRRGDPRARRQPRRDRRRARSCSTTARPDRARRRPRRRSPTRARRRRRRDHRGSSPRSSAASPRSRRSPRAVCDQVGAARARAATPPSDGETLYAAADALDIAVLGALGVQR